MLKCWNHSSTTRNYAATYYKTLQEVPWHLWLKKLKNTLTEHSATRPCLCFAATEFFLATTFISELEQ